MNFIGIDGRLTEDPKGRQTNNGKYVATLAIANNEGFGDKKQTTYFDIEVWEKSAENCCTYLSKGDLVAVTGKMMQDEWTDKDGKTQRRYKIKYASVEFKQIKPKVEQVGKAVTEKEEQDLWKESIVNDDDIPF